MQDALNSDQTTAFASFDRVENLVKFHVRSVSGTVNDVDVIRDLENKTWFFDMDKFYSGITELDDKYYAGSSFSYRVVQDEVGTDDDADPVYFEYLSTRMTL